MILSHIKFKIKTLNNLQLILIPLQPSPKDSQSPALPTTFRSALAKSSETQMVTITKVWLTSKETDSKSGSPRHPGGRSRGATRTRISLTPGHLATGTAIIAYVVHLTLRGTKILAVADMAWIKEERMLRRWSTEIKEGSTEIGSEGTIWGVLGAMTEAMMIALTIMEKVATTDATEIVVERNGVTETKLNFLPFWSQCSLEKNSSIFNSKNLTDKVFTKLTTITVSNTSTSRSKTSTRITETTHGSSKSTILAKFTSKSKIWKKWVSTKPWCFETLFSATLNPRSHNTAKSNWSKTPPSTTTYCTTKTERK